MKRMDDTSRLLVDIDSSDGDVLSRAAVALHRLGHARALEACLRTLDDAPDPLHADRTPSVQCLIEIGEPALPPFIDRLESEDRDTRMHAERAVQGIARRRFGFDGIAWPEALWSDEWIGGAPSASTAPPRRPNAPRRLNACASG